MATNLRAKFEEWIFVFVLIPATLTTLLCNVIFDRLQKQSYDRPLQDQATRIHAAIEQSLRNEAIRLKNIAGLPSTQSLIELSARNRGSAQDIDAQWASASREDLLVRGILDNDVGLLLRNQCEQQSYLMEYYLAEPSGRLLAASHITPRFLQNHEFWWNLTESTALVAGTDLDNENHIYLAYLFFQPTPLRPNAIKAILCVKIDAVTLLQQAANQHLPTEPEATVVLAGTNALSAQGSTNLFHQQATALQQTILQKKPDLNYTDGVHYATRTLDAGIQWRAPLTLAYIESEKHFPSALYGPIFWGWGIGLAFVAFVYFCASGIGRKLFFDPMLESVEAGLWILKKAFRGDTNEQGGEKKPAWTNLTMHGDSPLQQQLSQWVAESSAEMRLDIALAMEFQKSFMHEAYPKVPAIRRTGKPFLVFNHRYKPATAVGGDFFNIQALKSDRAEIFIADVVGRGTQGALITALLRMWLDKLRHHQLSPHLELKEINKRLCSTLKNYPTPFFSTACYFVADTSTNEGVYSLAGHPAPFHVSRSRLLITRLPVPQKSVALGLLPEETYYEGRMRLAPDDVVIFFTDGAYEATGPDGEEFGLTRIENCLRRNLNGTVDQMLDAIFNEIASFTGKDVPRDDICLVAVEMKISPASTA